MRYRANEKVNYYRKRENDMRATTTQRDYARGFGYGVCKAEENFNMQSSVKSLEGMQKSLIRNKTKTAISSGEKQGYLTVINSLLHEKRKHPLYPFDEK